MEGGGAEVFQHADEWTGGAEERGDGVEERNRHFVYADFSAERFFEEFGPVDHMDVFAVDDVAVSGSSFFGGGYGGEADVADVDPVEAGVGHDGVGSVGEVLKCFTHGRWNEVVGSDDAGGRDEINVESVLGGFEEEAVGFGFGLVVGERAVVAQIAGLVDGFIAGVGRECVDGAEVNEFFDAGFPAGFDDGAGSVDVDVAGDFIFPIFEGDDAGEVEDGVAIFEGADERFFVEDVAQAPFGFDVCDGVYVVVEDGFNVALALKQKGEQVGSDVSRGAGDCDIFQFG